MGLEMSSKEWSSAFQALKDGAARLEPCSEGSTGHEEARHFSQDLVISGFVVKTEGISLAHLFLLHTKRKPTLQ